MSEGQRDAGLGLVRQMFVARMEEELRVNARKGDWAA